MRETERWLSNVLAPRLLGPATSLHHCTTANVAGAWLTHSFSHSTHHFLIPHPTTHPTTQSFNANEGSGRQSKI